MNQILKNSLRTVKNQIGRFIALFVMGLLGVFVFAGLQAASPDMLTTIDHFLDAHDGYDIKIVSTMGLTDDDIRAVCQLREIEAGEGEKSIDVLTPIKGNQYAFRVAALPKRINRIDLLDGRLPVNNNEIVVEKNFLTVNDLQLNDTVVFDNEFLANTQFTIVGTVLSPQYYNSTTAGQSRGSTTIGSGSLNYYAYVPDSAFTQDYYTYAYFTVKGAKNLLTSGEEYQRLIKNALDGINSIRSEREKARADSIKGQYAAEIDEKEKEVNQQLTQAQSTLLSQLSEASTGIGQLEEGYRQLKSGREELDRSWKEYYSQLESNGLISVDVKKIDLFLSESLSILKEQSDRFPGNRLIKQAIDALTDLKNQLSQLISAEQQLNAAEETFRSQLAVFQNAVAELQSGQQSMSGAQQLIEEKKSEAEIQISDARNQLAKIKKPQWLIEDRTGYQTYSEYINDADSIRNLSFVFPIVFFAVAVLISLISMSRMVEDDRTEIGTMKSLGFSNRQIMTKYLVFASAASISGSLLGAFSGIIVLPELIYNVYRLVFDLPKLIIGFNPGTTILGILLSVVCVVGTTVLTVLKVVREKPAMLMRPKPPKKGSRVLLERVGFIWKRLSFSQKVSVRNLFRYKIKGLVTIIGIAGCTALILCGFGLRDSIIDIPDKQFGEVFSYNGMAVANSGDLQSNQQLFNSIGVDQLTQVQQNKAEVNKIKINFCIVQNDESLSQIMHLKDLKSGKKLTVNADSCIISDKLADLENIKTGDTITVKNADNKEYEFTVTGICENYFDHYVFIHQDTFRSLGQDFVPNIVYFKVKDESEAALNALSEKLLRSEKIINVTFMSTMMDTVNNMLQTLNTIVVILIVLAAMLAFVVLYNLANININERQREIATLKVLGFYDREVDSYIIKESIILTLIGIVIGLIAGYFLAFLVIGTVEIELSRFVRHIKLASYFYTAGISLLFTLLVSVATHFSLKKINMIESLKSVE